MIVEWRGRTWGTLESGVLVQSAQGIENIILNAAAIAGGRHGSAPAPSFADPGAFVLELAVLANTADVMAEDQNDIKAATWSEETEPEDPLTFTIPGQDPLTIFSRVASRVVDTDFKTSARTRAAVVPVAFDACDPMVYGPEVTVELDPGESTVIAGGWASSMRWTWTADGPVVNPRLRVHTDGYPDQTLRLVGSVPDGQQMVVASGPSSLVHTVGGIDRYGDFDPGNANLPPRFPKLLPGQTVFYEVASGTGPAVLSYWPARP